MENFADFLIILLLGAMIVVIVSAVIIGISQKLLDYYWPKWACEKFDTHPEPNIIFQDPVWGKIAKCRKCNKVIYFDIIKSSWCEHEDQTRIF